MDNEEWFISDCEHNTNIAIKDTLINMSTSVYQILLIIYMYFYLHVYFDTVG